jgi:hypothetical protein
MTLDLFTARPWAESPIRLPQQPVGMLGQHEVALFYHLARDYFADRGTIVDAGSFLGLSAFCFASGLKLNPCFDAARHRIHCYDNFLVNEANTVAFMASQLRVQVKVGDSTRAVFDRQVQDVASMLEVHPGDFHKEVWRGGAIEILMVDVAKRLSLWRHLLAQMFPHLVPGVSLVVHQDYHHPHLPFIHVVMADLAPYFEIVGSKVDDSCVFLLREAIPPAALQRAIAYDYTADERAALMEQAIDRLPESERYAVRLAGVRLRAQDGMVDGLDAEIAAAMAAPVLPAQRPAWEGLVAGEQDHAEEASAWWSHGKGNWPRGLELADRLLLRRGPRGTWLHLRGSALLGLGRVAEGEATLRAAITCPPVSCWAHVRLAQLLVHSKRFDDAEVVLLQALDDPATLEHSTARPVFEAFGVMWLAAGDVAAAARVLDRLRDRWQHDLEYQLLCVHYDALVGKRDAARRGLDNILAAGMDPERTKSVQQLLRT